MSQKVLFGGSLIAQSYVLLSVPIQIRRFSTHLPIVVRNDIYSYVSQ